MPEKHPIGFALLRCISSYLSYHMYIILDVHTESTIAAGECELLTFHRHLEGSQTKPDMDIILTQKYRPILLCMTQSQHRRTGTSQKPTLASTCSRTSLKKVLCGTTAQGRTSLTTGQYGSIMSIKWTGMICPSRYVGQQHLALKLHSHLPLDSQAGPHDPC